MTTVLRLGNVSPAQGHRLDEPADAAPIALAAARARGATLNQAMKEATAAVGDVVEAPTGELVHRRKLAAFELDPELEKRHDGHTVTEYVIPGSMDPGEALANVQRTWETYHSDDWPEWVEGEGPDGELLAALVARAYTRPDVDAGDKVKPGHKCRVGRPRGWKGLEQQREAPFAGGAQETTFTPGELARFDLARRERELRTNAGLDFQADVMGGGALANAGTLAMRPADYIGLTENATAPAAGDTALTGELATAGLGRSQAAYSHTAGASTYLLSKTFTVVAGDAPPKTPAKYGVFNAAAAGRMPFSSLISNPPALLAADQLTVNVTVSL